MEFISVNPVKANSQVVHIILSNKEKIKSTFLGSFYYIYRKSLSFLIKEKLDEKKFLEFLKEKIEKDFKKGIKNAKIINDFFDFLDWKNEEEILEHFKDYTLLLMPFEGKNSNLFVRFFVTSPLKEEIIAAFGFSFNSFFYSDIYGNYFFKTNLEKGDYILLERKIKEHDEDYEIKSRSLVINLIEDLYQTKEFLIINSPNYSFLLTFFGIYPELHSVGYNFEIEELFFSIFFYENSQLKDKKKLKVIDEQLNYFTLK